ncbi:MAG: class I SAM-dependent methyltransferase [Vicinamibacterales bacterium]
MTSAHVPAPAVMPVDREHWFRQLDLSNFVNAYYQFRDLSQIDGCRRVLIVGPGQGLQTEVLKWRGYEVTTLDIDETFKPDVIGSVHDMNMFRDRQFDAVIASHVLEHLAVAYLDRSLRELSRVAAYALIYLPVAGRHVQARLQPGFKGIDLSVVFDLFNYLHRPNGVEAKYCGGQHFWEVGMRGFRVGDLKRRMSTQFDVVDVYRNRDWNPSLNFVLRSKRATSA